jgi:hypothetical protein
MKKSHSVGVGIWVSMALLATLSSAVSFAETPQGLVAISSESGWLYDLNGTICYEPGRPMALGLVMNRSYRERMYYGPFSTNAVWKLVVNGNQVFWNSAEPSAGEWVVRPNGSTYRLRGTYFKVPKGDTPGVVHVTLPESARGEVPISMKTPEGVEVAGAGASFVSSRTPGVRCEREMASIFYRAIPAEPRAPFTMIGGGDFSYIPGVGGAEPVPGVEGIPQRAPDWLCRVIPVRGCFLPRHPDEESVPAPGEGGVGIGRY